jgi:hypothetical protein
VKALRLPDGQGTFWRIPGPREGVLKSAILRWADLHPRLIRLARTPAGSWNIPGRPQAGDGVEPDRSDDPTSRSTGRRPRRSGYWLVGAPEGWPDLTGFVPAGLPKRSGCAVLVECKRSKAHRPTPAQVEHLTAVVEAGGVGILAWAVDQFIAEYLDAVGIDPNRPTLSV